ncbi:MAG: VCBS repeat-containing protein, partial [Bacteroidota bacterium]
MRHFATLFFLLLAALYMNGQSIMRMNPPVEQNGNMLDLAFAGGLNQAQYNQMDLDQDGIEDLVIMDRAGNKVICFRNTGSDYEYAPNYQEAFPNVQNWMLLADYDCDGKADLFTGNSVANSIRVFHNVSGSNTLLFALET